MNAIKKAVVETLPVAAWIAVSAGLTYMLTHLLEKPELAPYYGIINIGLFLLKEISKRK